MSVLENQVAVVTGAGTGIGRAVAETFSREGAAVALLGRRQEPLREVAAQLPRDRVLTCACDVSSRNQVDGVFARIRERLGVASLLVNNAGINTVVRDLAHIEPSDWDHVLAVNLTGAFNCIRAVLPGMRELGGGVIINVSSIAGKRASKVAGVAYVASKHGMVGLTHSTNREQGDNGIRSTVILPGEVDTPILDVRPEPVPREWRERILRSEDVAACALLVAGLPPRVCVPEIVVTPTIQSFS
jgi:NAD(P)-dependent dehydrogenase (short-subunit alcohol dehydrogenase family)